MSKSRRGPGPQRRFVTRQRGYDVYTVNAFGVRELTRGDEEFTNFATHGDFPRLVPAREIWIDARLYEPEGVFYLAEALVRLARLRDGASDDAAYQAGLDADRALREQLL
jgi:hypothetical protein